MAEAEGRSEGAGDRPSYRAQIIWIALVGGAFAAFQWLGPAARVPQMAAMFFAAVALLAFLLLPVPAQRARWLAVRAGASLALGALVAGIVWLAFESRAVIMALALYFVLWWTLLFAVLPWGVRSQHEAQEITPGSDPGAPVSPLILKKVFATSVVAAVVLGVVLLFLYFRPIPNILPFA